VFRPDAVAARVVAAEHDRSAVRAVLELVVAVAGVDLDTPDRGGVARHGVHVPRCTVPRSAGERRDGVSDARSASIDMAVPTRRNRIE
jgi:hypothetical protein